MYKKLLYFVVVFMCASNVCASNLDIALQKTYVDCIGVDDMLSDMKTLAGINTAVTGVGTVAGGAALVVGIKKSQELYDRLREIEESGEQQGSSDNKRIVITQQTGFKHELKSKAKKLGNWRTGLLVVNTATNVAGAIIASKNEDNVDLQDKIQKCIKSTDELQNAIAEAKFNNEDISEAQDIYNACSEYKYTDLSVISKRAKGAKISSIVGGGTGAVGAIISHTANNSSGDKEKQLDTVSNVLAGGATVFTGAATVFNAMQISAIKKVVDVAEKCESLLR